MKSLNFRQKKTPVLPLGFFLKRVHLAILTPSRPGTIFTTRELNGRVRNVTGCFLSVIDIPKLYIFRNHITESNKIRTRNNKKQNDNLVPVSSIHY